MDDKLWKTDLGFDNVKDFYDLLSSHKNTRRIKVPMLSINSRDDPICPTHSIPKEEMQSNGNLIHIETGGGGHVEFLTKMVFPEMVICLEKSNFVLVVLQRRLRVFQIPGERLF